MKKSTFHCHTQWSDGRATVAAMVREAEIRGFSVIGISDHLVFHPEIREMWWIIPPDRIRQYADEVRAVAEKAKIPVLLGAEVDFFPDNPRLDEFLRIRDEIGFDYLIGSVHMLGRFPIDDKPDSWKPLTQKEIDGKYRDYWRNMRLMAETGLFDFVGHLDLPKKFQFQPSIDFHNEIEAVLNAVKSQNMGMEINTAGWDKPCHDAYPSLPILQRCSELEIPMVINDDAHGSEELGRYWDRAQDRLQETGCKTRWMPAVLR